MLASYEDEIWLMLQHCISENWSVKIAHVICWSLIGKVISNKITSKKMNSQILQKVIAHLFHRNSSFRYYPEPSLHEIDCNALI